MPAMKYRVSLEFSSKKLKGSSFVSTLSGVSQMVSCESQAMDLPS